MWNGFGGKPDLGETMQECAIRELQVGSMKTTLMQEEACLIATNMLQCGVTMIARPDETLVIAIFRCERWIGDAEE